MINLLHLDTKQRLKAEQNKLKLSLILSGVGFCLIVLNSLNFGLWLLFHEPADILGSSALVREDKDNALSELDKVVCLADWWPKSFWFEALDQLETESSSVTRSKQFSGTWDIKKNERTLAWQGEIAKREELVALSERLRAGKYFAEVKLPFDNLVASEKQGDFAIQLKLKSK